MESMNTGYVFSSQDAGNCHIITCVKDENSLAGMLNISVDADFSFTNQNLTTRFPQNSMAYITGLLVNVTHRGQGIAKEMMKMAVDWLDSNHLTCKAIINLEKLPRERNFELDLVNLDKLYEEAGFLREGNTYTRPFSLISDPVFVEQQELLKRVAVDCKEISELVKAYYEGRVRILSREEMIKEAEKTCGNCLNCDKINVGTPTEFWACDVYGLHHGYPSPANVTPPNDGACDEWSDTVRTDIDKEL